jgi:hypothetical protein
MNREPGIHLNVPAAEYHALPGASATALKIIHTSTPLHCHHRMSQPFEETPAMKLGTLVHHALMEPDRPFPIIAQRPEFYLCPADSSLVKSKKASPGDLVPWHGAAKYCKDWIAAQQAAGNIILTSAEYDNVIGMARALASHPIVSRLFARGKSEVTIISHDHELNVPLRCRIDWVPEDDGGEPITLDTGEQVYPHECIVDLKTTSDPSPAGFSKQIANLAYHLQAAWYQDLFACEADNERGLFVFVAVENEPPFDVGVYSASRAMLDAGQKAYMRALAKWARCNASGVWPGTPGEVIKTLEMPKWATEPT